MACSCSEIVLSISGCCCFQECACPEASTGSQGPQGNPGSAGAAGATGQNAFTLTNGTWTTPAISATVSIPVVNGLWVAIGQDIFIESSGVYKVTAFTSSAITGQNTGAIGNIAAGNLIAINKKVSPSGYIGVLATPVPIASGGTGQATATLAFNALSPLTTNGDTLVRESGSNVRKPIGMSGQIPVSNGTIWNWAANAPAATSLTGQVPIANGGTSANTAASARTALAVPGIATNNSFVGQNTFDLTAGQTFRVSLDSDPLIAADDTQGVVIYDLSGGATADFLNKYLIGAWTQLFKSYIVANASTFSAWSNVETVISTYSLTATQAITLPAGANGRVIRIVDGGGNASNNAITINRAGSDLIMGATSYTINLNYGSISFIYLSASTNWVPFT